MFHNVDLYMCLDRSENVSESVYLSNIYAKKVNFIFNDCV